MSFGNILYTTILYPIVQIIEISFRIFGKIFGNTGIAVIGVSITVTLLCLPLYIVAEHWQQIERNTQAKLKPGIERIKSVFKGDEQYMILSAFYKQNHYHPIMALRSSFGLLIQIPFFMAAYSCLSKMPDLQGEQFFFIRDMGQQDALFYIGKMPVNILPIAMTVINIIAGAIYTKGFPVKEKIQIYGMAVIFLVLLYSSPSGLVLYWTMNNVFSLIKNIFYKMKNPLKVFYFCAAAGIVFIAVYVMFIYNGGASMKKRLAAVIPLILLIFIPLYLKIIGWGIRNPLSQIMKNKKLRLNLFLFSAVSLAILTGLVLPSSLISSSVQEFSNVGSYTSPVNFLHSPFWQAAGLFILWPLCIYFLFNEKVQTVISVIFSVGLGWAIVNTYVFAGNYGSMDITLKFIGEMNSISKNFIFINLAALVILTVLYFVIFHFKKTHILNSVIFVSIIAFAAVSVINISKLKKDYKEYTKISASNEENEFSKKLHFSKTGKNIIVIMLDRAESAYFETVLKDRPAIAESLTGFIYYKNTISYNGHTLMGAPGIYGGYEYTPSEINKRSDLSLKDKNNEALLLMPKILTEKADFNATLSDLSWANYSYSSDMHFVENMKHITGYKLAGRYTGDFKKEYLTGEQSDDLIKSVNRNLLWVSFFREAPAAIRPAVYYKGSWWASETAADIDSFADWFSILTFLDKISDFSNEKNNLIIMTNEATHSNADLSLAGLVDEKTLSLNSKDDQGYAGNVLSLQALANWFDFLKKNNVYENTRIIIAADHGIGYGTKTSADYVTPEINGVMKDHFHPLFLVKDFNSAGPLKTSMDFMTNADTPSIVFDGIIDDPVNPFTGNKVNSDLKKDGALITIDDVFMPHHSRSNKIFTVKSDSWYRVKDNIFIDSNWIKESQ